MAISSHRKHFPCRAKACRERNGGIEAKPPKPPLLLRIDDHIFQDEGPLIFDSDDAPKARSELRSSNTMFLPHIGSSLSRRGSSTEMKAQSACVNCRSRKRKCVVPEEGLSCSPCMSRNVQCSFARKDGTDSPSSMSSGAPYNFSLGPQPSPGEVNLPDQTLCNELVDLYFDLIHEKQHVLFHRPTFIATQRQGQAPIALIFAMIALSARFSSNVFFSNTHPWERGRLWAKKSIELFNSRSETISLQSLQICHLLLHIAFIEGDMDSESLYAALAIRMVQRLDLPHKLSTDRIEREIQIRNPIFPKPMEEFQFDRLTPGLYSPDDEGSLDVMIQRRNSGIWAQMIPLIEVISRIDELHQMTVQQNKGEKEIYDVVESIAFKLDSWLLRLPPQLQNSPENLQRFSYIGHGRAFVALHLGYHHHGQLLYYQFLHQDPTTSPQPMLIYAYANRCKDHAKKLSNLVWMANLRTDCECLWVMTGHLLAVSSSIHLHTLLFGSTEAEITEAKTFLRQNFEMMIRLRRFWPSLDLSLSRLRAFHRACQKSMNTTFAMDPWMLHFLQRFMKPMDETNEQSSQRKDSEISGWLPSQDSDELYRGLWSNDLNEMSASDVLDSFL